MSYRVAWKRLKASEERMKKKLVETGIKKKSLHLTSEVRAIIERFEKLEKDVENILHKVDKDFKNLF
jgi:molybdate transport repressor ModE-like protein